jgi:hypothetical protein
VHPLLALFTVPGQKSPAVAKRLVAEVGDDPEKFAVFLAAMLHPATPTNLARYAAGVAEKISRRYPALLVPHTDALIAALPRVTTSVMRWHLALLLSYLPLTDDDQLGTVIDYVHTWLHTDPNKFLKVHCLQALANLSQKHEWLKAETIMLIQAEMAKGGAAANAKGRVLLQQLQPHKRRNKW